MMDSHLLVVSGGRAVQSSQRDEEESNTVGMRLLISSHIPLQSLLNNNAKMKCST
jgi:hypothetical protein